MHKASPEPQSLTPAQAVWPSILPLSGDTAALSTQPEPAVFSGREAFRGKTRAEFERATARPCIYSPAELRGGPLQASPSSFTPFTDSVQGTDDGEDGAGGTGRWTLLSLNLDSAILPVVRALEGELCGLRATLLFYKRALECCQPHTYLYKHGCQSNALRTDVCLGFISCKNMLTVNQKRT